MYQKIFPRVQTCHKPKLMGGHCGKFALLVFCDCPGHKAVGDPGGRRAVFPWSPAASVMREKSAGAAREHRC